MASVAPKASDIPPKDTVEFNKEVLAILVRVLEEPEIVLFSSVSVDVSVKTTPSISILTLSAVTVVVIPVPPSKVIAVSYTHLTLPTTPYV